MFSWTLAYKGLYDLGFTPSSVRCSMQGKHHLLKDA